MHRSLQLFMLGNVHHGKNYDVDARKPVCSKLIITCSLNRHKNYLVAGFDFGLAYICSFTSLWCFIVFKLGGLKLSLCVNPVSGLVLIRTFFLLGSNICSKLSFITRPLDWHKNAHCDRPWHWTFLHLFLTLLSERIWCCIVFRLGGLKLSVCVNVLLAWIW